MTNTNQINPSILLVDDDDDLLVLAKIKLSRIGYKVRVSPNADNIVGMILEERPDIILLDITMQGINGGDICHALKGNNKTADIPVIIISGNDDIEKIAASCGADDYVEKPFQISRVREKITHVLMSNSSSQLRTA